MSLILHIASRATVVGGCGGGRAVRERVAREQRGGEASGHCVARRGGRGEQQ